MNVKPNQLQQYGYILLDSLEHKALIPFIQIYLKKKTFAVIFYWATNILIFLIILLRLYQFFQLGKFKIIDVLDHLSYGVALAFCLVPIHEYIHALAYKSQGAKTTSYDVNLKKFYFMAIADKFVANRKEFTIVALAPFLIISSTFLISLLFVEPLWTFTILGILFTHTACCSGDFGLLSYFEFYKHKKIITYDDKENGISYFYELQQ